MVTAYSLICACAICNGEFDDRDSARQVTFDAIPVRKLVGDAATLLFHTTPDGEDGPVVVASHRCICVRGLFALNEQLALMSKALKISQAEARKRFTLEEFELERQESTELNPEWSKIAWKTVSRDSVLKLLEESSAFVDDVVHPDEIESAITMPLPRLSAGNWKTLGSHPSLKAGVASGQLLFRILDLDVAKGRKYRYRVRLQFTDSADKGDRTGPWSDPGPVVAVEK